MVTFLQFLGLVMMVPFAVCFMRVLQCVFTGLAGGAVSRPKPFVVQLSPVALLFGLLRVLFGLLRVPGAARWLDSCAAVVHSRAP